MSMAVIDVSSHRSAPISRFKELELACGKKNSALIEKGDCELKWDVDWYEVPNLPPDGGGSY